MHLNEERRPTNKTFDRSAKSQTSNLFMIVQLAVSHSNKNPTSTTTYATSNTGYLRPDLLEMKRSELAELM